MTPRLATVRGLLLASLVLYLPFYSPRLVSDGALYHEILRSLAIDGDLNFDNEREFYTWRYVPVFDTYGVGAGFHDTGYPRHPFNIGAPLLWFPFFLVGHGVAVLLELVHAADVIADGYSFPERLASSLTSLPAALVGLALTLRLLAGWRRSDPDVAEADEDLTLALPAAAVVLLASPLPAFVLVAPTFAHMLSYVFSAAFLTLLMERFGRARTREQDIALGLVVGFAALVRTQCGFLLVALVLEPFAMLAATRSKAEIGRRLLPSWIRIGAAAFLAFSPQIASNLVIFGELFLDPQGDNGMNWTRPQFGNVLWDAKHGLFATTPFLIVPSLALPFLLRRRPWHGAALLLALLVQLYLNAVRRDWAGVGFGMRRFIEVLPIFTVAFAELLWLVRRRIALVGALLAAGVVAIAWNLMLMAQYYLTDLSRPFAKLAFGQIVKRNLELAPRLMPELASRSLVASAIASPDASHLLELFLFAVALLLLHAVVSGMERAWPLLVELFPILVLAIAAAIVTVDAFLIYSRSSTRHVVAYMLDERRELSDAERARLAPAVAARFDRERQGPDRIWRSRHLALRENAAYEGLLGGFELSPTRAAIRGDAIRYGAFLEEGAPLFPVFPSRDPRLYVDARARKGGLVTAAGIDLVIHFESWEELGSPMFHLELRPPGAGPPGDPGASVPQGAQPPAHLALEVRRDDVKMSVDAVDPSDVLVTQSWCRTFAKTELGGGAMSIHATFEPPVRVGSIVVRPTAGSRGVTIRGLALETVGPPPADSPVGR